MLLVVLLVAAAVVVGGWWWMRNSRDVATELDRFAVARAMTSKWAQDPASAPRPVLDIASRGGRPISDPDERESTDSEG